jgi:hypothetical protein
MKNQRVFCESGIQTEMSQKLYEKGRSRTARSADDTVMPCPRSGSVCPSSGDGGEDVEHDRPARRQAALVAARFNASCSRTMRSRYWP